MKRADSTSRLKEWMPVAISLALFVLMVFGALRFTMFKKDQWEKDAKGRLLEVLVAKKTKLEKALYSRIHYTRSVAAYVSLRPDITSDEFDNLANQLIQDDSVIGTMALSKDCIIGAVFPMKGHEKAIGLNLLEHPERLEIVEKTIETHETYVAGPVELVEGGIAFISYTPIFDKSTGEKDLFWGVTDIVIMLDRLLNEARLQNHELGNHFALRGYNGQGWEGAVFWGEDAVFLSDPITVEIELPYGKWILAAVPERGWATYLDQDRFLLTILISSSLIISLLIGLFARAMIRIRRNERELRKMNATKDILFSIIAHDLKSPFNSLLGFTEILEEQLDTLTHDELRKMMQSLRKTTLQTHDLLTNLLNWSMAQRGHLTLKPEKHTLVKIVQRALLQVDSQALKKGITIENLVGPENQAWFDEETIVLVVRNLLSNAVKFTHRNGRIEISSSLHKQMMCLCITDNGVGIEASALQKIFKVDQHPSTRGTENEKGTGLGLILCKEFTEMNQGTIRVESEPGKGSKFSIYLPLS